VTSYFEWIGAGLYRVDARSGSMHGKKFLIHEVQFGTDGRFFYLRLDFCPGCEDELNGVELRMTFEPFGSKSGQVVVALNRGEARITEVDFLAAGDGSAECALADILEARFPLAALGVMRGAGVRFQLSLWQSGLPVDAVPQQGWIEMPSTDPAEFSA
jgi:hypothetical protein